MPENDQDIIILKATGIPTYHFAHVIDDHFMRTTHVVRGEEWLMSLPIHVELFRKARLRNAGILPHRAAPEAGQRQQEKAQQEKRPGAVARLLQTGRISPAGCKGIPADHTEFELRRVAHTQILTHLLEDFQVHDRKDEQRRRAVRPQQAQ